MAGLVSWPRDADVVAGGRAAPCEGLWCALVTGPPHPSREDSRVVDLFCGAGTLSSQAWNGLCMQHFSSLFMAAQHCVGVGTSPH